MSSSGLRYQPNEYIVDLLMNRTARTLLVEGANDSRAIARLLLELYDGSPPIDIIVDTAEMIESPAGRMGNREKVEYVHRLANGQGTPLAGVVDREFRDFTLFPVGDPQPAHKVVDQTLFWTRGHSLENYHLDLSYIFAFLENTLPERLPANHRAIVAASFERVLNLVAAFSLAGYVTGLLDTMRNVLTIDRWIRGAVPLELDRAAIEMELATRHVAPLRSSTFFAYFDQFAVSLAASPSELSRWIAHGHIAEDAVWAGIARRLIDVGFTQGDGERIATDHKDRRRRDLVTSWSKDCLAGSPHRPLPLMTWLKP